MYQFYAWLCLINFIGYFVAFSIFGYVVYMNGSSTLSEALFFFVGGLFCGGFFGYIPLRLMNLMKSKNFIKKLKRKYTDEKIEMTKGAVIYLCPPSVLMATLLLAFVIIPKAYTFYLTLNVVEFK